MKEPFDMVDENIDIFIHIGRHRWDFVRLIFDRDPIYDIEGIPEEVLNFGGIPGRGHLRVVPESY
jgi:hypothetical protein